MDRTHRAALYIYDLLAAALYRAERASVKAWHASHVALAWIIHLVTRWCPHHLRFFATCPALFHPERRIIVDENSLAWRCKTCRVCNTELSRRTSQRPPLEKSTL